MALDSTLAQIVTEVVIQAQAQAQLQQQVAELQRLLAEARELNEQLARQIDAAKTDESEKPEAERTP